MSETMPPSSLPKTATEGLRRALMRSDAGYGFAPLLRPQCEELLAEIDKLRAKLDQTVHALEAAGRGLVIDHDELARQIRDVLRGY